MRLRNVLTVWCLLLGGWAATASVHVIPVPNHMESQEGVFVFTPKTCWITETAEAETAARLFYERFAETAGWQYTCVTGTKAGKNSVFFRQDTSLNSEEYRLEVQPTGIRIVAADKSGFFYAVQTLRQLLPVEIEKHYPVSGVEWSVPCVNISDKPRFGYRGFLLDVSRYFMPKKDVLRLLDVMALHKLNYFHWHLVDDNGWRIEIKRYPKLTDVGAWRVSRINMFPMRGNPERGEATPEGGYYTQDDVREIVKYAAERSIQVIPEIEMPAHINAGLAAYPELACPVAPRQELGVLPGIGGQNAANIYCAGNDTVFEFLQNVLDEIMTLFPCKYIHIGGDEADKYNWERCPKCQARMQQEHLENEEELQSYFIKRINKYLRSHGKRLMGWDELVDSRIPEDAIIFGWRGMGQGAEKAAMQGFDYIKSPAQRYYLIRYQGPQWFEPFTYFGNTTLRDVYTYEPLPDTADVMLKKHIKGVEACMWTEFVNNTSDAEYLIFPRLAAYAETAWSEPENKNWEAFLPRVDALVLRYDALQITSARSMFNIDHSVEAANGQLRVTLENIRPDLEIRYTTDGTEPQPQSVLYKKPFDVAPGTVVRAATFKNGVRQGRILPLNTMAEKTTGCPVTSAEANAYVLTNGVRGSEKMSDGEWVDCYDKDTEFVVDLRQTTDFTAFTLGMLNNSGMGVHFPSEITLLVSTDGQEFTEVFRFAFSTLEAFQNGVFRQTYTFDCGQQSARYLKLQVKNPGKTPQGLVRSGLVTRFALDEITIK